MAVAGRRVQLRYKPQLREQAKLNLDWLRGFIYSERFSLSHHSVPANRICELRSLPITRNCQK